MDWNLLIKEIFFFFFKCDYCYQHQFKWIHVAKYFGFMDVQEQFQLQSSEKQTIGMTNSHTKLHLKSVLSEAIGFFKVPWIKYTFLHISFH